MKEMSSYKTIYASPKDDLRKVIESANSFSRIVLKAGVHRCKAEIDSPHIVIESESGTPADTIIEWDDYARKTDENGVELNTFRTYTVAVCADNVTLRNITLKNSAGNSPQKGQEVALTVYGDEFCAENCIFDSEQDTLFCGPLPKDLIERYNGFLKDKLRKDIRCRQRYTNCIVRGTVDFVFGCGDCLFENCTFVSKNDGRTGFVAAPAHAEEQKTGFVFCNCTFEGAGETPQCVFLARPWRDFGKASFIRCVYGAHIDKRAFDKWNDTSRDKTARFSESPAIDGRVNWSKTLSAEEIDSLLGYFDN